ncbi:ABC transporter ATP-binding protein [Wenyingzhuangia marina]|nr:ABC transporter ATP-binding protein [Wenyingzhuangia marina]
MTLIQSAMITIENLNFNHSKEKQLFQDLTLQLNSGNIVGLLGKNGAGKSTLLQLLSGLLSQKSGNIDINGFEPYDKNPNFLSDLYLVTDEPYVPNIKIKSFIKNFAPLYPNFDVEKLKNILIEFQLDENMKLDKISYGQRKKFIIAFALATNSKLLLLDEPTNGLDIPSKKIFRKVLIESINEDQLVMISTHQVKDIETIIDKIIVIDHGRITFNHDLYEIAEKLQFKKVPSIHNEDQVFYSEKCPEGYHIITPVNKNEETEVDMELLFNAINNNIAIHI